MDNQNFERELATKIEFKDTHTTEGLTYIGSGTTCLVYRTDSGEIIKEFAPLINGTPVMSRKNGANEPQTPLESLTEHDLQVLEERKKAFLSERDIIALIQSYHKNDNDNMFLLPEDKDTSLGTVHYTRYLGGELLSDVVEQVKECGFRERFLCILCFVVSLFREIAIYHQDGKPWHGVLNLDIKPDNLFCIRSHDKFIGVRNLDFGSAKRIDDTEVGKLGLISSIRKFAAETVGEDEILEQIKNKDLYSFSFYDEKALLAEQASKLFASSPYLYDESRIIEIIEDCIYRRKDDETIISKLKNLDILAAWKTFLFSLYDGEVSSKNEIEMVNEIFDNLFENEKNVVSNSLWENYYLYTQLYEIQAKILISDGLTATEIADRLENIYHLVNKDLKLEINQREGKKTEEVKHFKAVSASYRKEDEDKSLIALDSFNLESIKDILRFCEKNGLSEPETPSNLYWFLLTGTKH